MHSTATDEVLLTTVFATGFKCSNCTWVFQNTPVKFKAPPPHETWLTWTRTNMTGGGGGLVAAAPVTTSRVWACQWEMANSDALHNRNWLPSEVYARKRLPLLNVGHKTAYIVSNLLLLLFNYYVIIIIYYFSGYFILILFISSRVNHFYIILFYCWHCPRSMRSKVYVTVELLSVCLPLWPRRSTAATAAISIDSRRRRSAATAGSATLTADGGGWTQTC